jgi:hypothetical protein
MNELTRRQLDAYLDGTMAERDRHAFERMMAMDRELKQAVHRQKSIDQSLRRMFPVSSSATVEAVLQQAQQESHAASQTVTSKPSAKTAPPPEKHVNWRRRLAVAAALLGGAYGIWSTYSFYFPPKPTFMAEQGGGIEPLKFDEYYTGKVKSGYQPYWVCENDAQFADTFRQRFGQALQMRSLPSNITCAGLDYCFTISELTTAVMLNIDDQKVVVLVDKADVAPRCRTHSDPNLRVFEATIGNLKLVEVSPFEAPKALDLFYNPDVASR